MHQRHDVTNGPPRTDPAPDPRRETGAPTVEEHATELLVEEVSIDGLCGVY